jgi:alpha-mannosidase
MHDDRAMVEERLGRALEQYLRPAVYGPRRPLDMTAWTAPGEPVPVEHALDATYEPIAVGQRWGSPWSTTWLRVRGEVPAEWAGQRVEAVFDLGFGVDSPGFQAEALAYTADGVPIKGIHPDNRYVPVAGDRVDLLVEAAANPTVLRSFAPTELGDRLTAPADPLYRLGRVDLAVLCEPAWHLVLDIEVLAGLMAALPVHEPRRHEILRALERMLDAVDLHDVASTAAAGRKQLAVALASPAHASAHRVSAVGHAHIDSAWLWPLRETVRKASRTFANVTALTHDYPELVFACSQAQQYAWVKEHQPHIYERIRKAVRDGAWAPVGSMWVEADANLPGGEALVRQLTNGKRFFADEFGIDTQEIWLPDSFGYTAAFPQLARLAGVRWFFTQKLSWNETNLMPHHTFWWEGIDGTRIFTHFPPVNTYNSQLSGAELALAAANFAEKGAATTSLVPFGHGDGGGGPTREMLERARRLRDLEGSPRVTVQAPAEFFARAYAEYPDAPTWTGEMYLENHRATFTTQAKTKAGNRRSEHLLREAELWSTAACVYAGAPYPYAELDRLWKMVLLHQFHDILPGSSIAWVHREARETYEAVRVELEALVDRAVAALGNGDDGVLNAAPHDRAEVVVVAGDQSVAGDRPGQRMADRRSAVWASAPAHGGGALRAEPPAGVTAVTVDASGDGIALDNGLVRVDLDADGLLRSVRDLVADRELIPPGERGNLLHLHPDHPARWDAWNIDRHYLRRRAELRAADAVTVVDAGPLLARVRVERRFGRSRVTQTYRLAAGARRLDIDSEVDWRESEKVLKAAFPLDVHADWSTAEIQFGHVHRPLHTNTSWDHARYEVYAHRWVHVAEPGYGVAIANDSTYGYDAARTTRDGGVAVDGGAADGGTTTTVRLTLLRAPHSPDPRTDQDLHRFTYALVPGADIGAAADAGYALNLPLRVVPGVGAVPALLTVDDQAVRVEAVKLADDASGDVVVRLYESRGGRATATVRAGFPFSVATEVDLLERDLGPDQQRAGLSAGGDGGLRVTLRPFQVVTLRLRR